MKKFTVTKAENYSIVQPNDKHLREFVVNGDEDMQVSDGYHTMDELYDHRISLFIALCKISLLYSDYGAPRFIRNVWRSKRHSDGEICFGTGTQFVLGMGEKDGEQITYHIPIERWEETVFAETMEKAPEWDGHTSKDVLERLKNI